MDKFSKSQLLTLSILATLLLMTPLLSSNLRPTYLYIITNILIIALGVEAGLLSVLFNPSEDRRAANNNNAPTRNLALLQQQPAMNSDGDQSPLSIAERAISASSPVTVALGKIENRGNCIKVVEKCASEKVSAINGGGKKENKFRRCPSMPSLFFIGSGTEDETEKGNHEAYHYQDQEDDLVEEGMINGQELFTKAETFIGDFYKQLKMQREESWKRIHGFYQKAF